MNQLIYELLSVSVLTYVTLLIPTALLLLPLVAWRLRTRGWISSDAQHRTEAFWLCSISILTALGWVLWASKAGWFPAIMAAYCCWTALSAMFACARHHYFNDECLAGNSFAKALLIAGCRVLTFMCLAWSIGFVLYLIVGISSAFGARTDSLESTLLLMFVPTAALSIGLHILLIKLFEHRVTPLTSIDDVWHLPPARK